MAEIWVDDDEIDFKTATATTTVADAVAVMSNWADGSCTRITNSSLIKF